MVKLAVFLYVSALAYAGKPSIPLVGPTAIEGTVTKMERHALKKETRNTSQVFPFGPVFVSILSPIDGRIYFCEADVNSLNSVHVGSNVKVTGDLVGHEVRHCIVWHTLVDLAPPPTRLQDAVGVYLYRIKHRIGGGINLSVYCDYKEVAQVQNGAYVVLKLAPGRHVLKIPSLESSGFHEILVSGQAGDTSYARIDVFTREPSFSLVSREAAKEDLVLLKRLESKKIKNADMVSMQ